MESGDDGFFTELAYEAVENGDINRVTMIIGMNSEESISQVLSRDLKFVSLFKPSTLILCLHNSTLGGEFG